MGFPIADVPLLGDTTRLSDEQAYTILRSMSEQLTSEASDMVEYRDYYEGDQELHYATEEFRKAFGDEFGDLKANWCEVAISATEERLEMDRIVFRNKENGKIDEELTSKVWKIFIDNDIDDLENELYSSSQIESRSAILVWPGSDGDDQDVLISVLRGTTYKVVYDDDNPRRITVGIRRWRTDFGEVFLTLYTPEWVYKYRIPKQYTDILSIPDDTTFEDSGWQKRDTDETGDPSWPLRNPFGRVPIVEFHARKNRSELKNITPIQDMVNKVLINMMVATDYAASSQAYIVSTNQEPDGGWKRRPGEVWQIQPEVDLDGKALPTDVGILPAEDPTNFIKVIEHLLSQFSNMSSTPGYYIFSANSQSGRGDAPSGDSLKVSETTLMKKVEKYQQAFEPRWKMVGDLVIAALSAKQVLVGSSKTGYSEVSWVNAQKQFMGMLLEEGRKMIAELELPHRYAWRHIGLSEAQIVEAEDELEKRREEQQNLQMEQAAQKTSDKPNNGMTRKTASQMNSGSTPKNT